MEQKIKKYNDEFEKIKPLVRNLLDKQGTINSQARTKGLQMIENIKKKLSPEREIDKLILDIAECWKSNFRFVIPIRI